MAGDGFYQQDHAAVKVIIDQLESTRLELESTYTRWEELEG